ncbi:lipoprotein [Gordoniibacillus kamchatkensis]|uniref:Lipoprotein n=1 Tax=Gordoniibacillus kamchatkensis TaxID=1590651 RepID=A0ABR5AIK1_9BACL|nr:PCYCGC motif-containing (lipo)protein [Paenibacillus sp. VKM B-2647]KIL40877.1 lipoprotein [Paenibacillus sp. VKM B-2647]
MKFRFKSLIAALSISFVVSACGSTKDQAHQGHSMNGDLQEKTASVKVLPKFLSNQPEQIRLVYEAAGNATEVLKWIPCYCGCGESAGHAGNMNCFIKQVNQDGSVVWDDHGTRCGVCLQIAAQSIKMKQDGKTLKEIRSYIDKTYEKGYAKPTNTPMPV